MNKSKTAFVEFTGNTALKEIPIEVLQVLLQHSISKIEVNGVKFTLEDESSRYPPHSEETSVFVVYAVSSETLKFSSKFIKINGYHSSYDGANYRDFTFVEPKVVSVTQWD